MYDTETREEAYNLTINGASALVTCAFIPKKVTWFFCASVSHP